LTIEEQMDAQLTKWWDRTRRRIPSCTEWKWYGDHFWVIGNSQPEGRRIEEIIKNSSISLCLTSPSEYIRERKMWYIENESR